MPTTVAGAITQPVIESGPSTLNLRRICLIRTLVLTGQSLALLLAKIQLQLPLAYFAIGVILLGVAALTAVSFWRLRQPWPVTEIELFAHLLIDVVTLTLLLYFAGGATNPFVSYYLIPLTIAAAALPRRFTWIIAALSVTAYTLLLFFYHPLELLAPQHAHGEIHGFSMHLLGMLATFAISVLLITYFVVSMARTLRQRDSALANARESTLRDEHILGIATLAAGTAHKLGTPLSTVSILVKELQRRCSGDNEAIRQCELIREQLDNCKSTLRSLSSVAELNDAHRQTTRMPADEYLLNLIDHWRAMRPEATPAVSITGTGDAPALNVSLSLDQAIQNLLNNAEDASPGRVSIDLNWNKHRVVIAIQDAGSGIAPELVQQIGQPFFTTKAKGLGLGLFLSHAAIERHQGSIQLYQQQGTLVELALPIDESPT